MKKLSILFILFPFFSFAQEDKALEPIFFKKNIAKKNDTTLIFIKDDLKSFVSNEKSKFNIGFSLERLATKSSSDKTLNINDVLDLGTEVNLKEAVAKLFDPSSQPCSLPEKVLKKLNKYKEENKMWAPRYVVQQLDPMPDKALQLRGSGLTTLLHNIKIIHADNSTEKAVIMGSPTYSNLSAGDYVAAGYNSFAYTLDCAGYLNAAIEGSATVPGADITTSAAAAMAKQSSTFIGGGVLVSPLYAAFYGDVTGVKMSKDERLAILKAIINHPVIAKTDIIELKSAYEVIWASSQGGESFNGKAAFASKGGIGIGVAQVSGSGNATGTISRSSSFSSFETYVTDRVRLSKPALITFTMLKDLIEELSK